LYLYGFLFNEPPPIEKNPGYTSAQL